eukprot:747602_1
MVVFCQLYFVIWGVVLATAYISHARKLIDTFTIEARRTLSRIATSSIVSVSPMPGTPILKRAATTTEVHPNKLIENRPKKKKLSRMTSLAQRRSSGVQHQPLFIRSGSVENQPKFIRSATSGTPHRDPDFTTHSPELESRRDSLTDSLPISVICRAPGSSVQSQEKNLSQIESGHPGGQMWSQVQHAKSCIEPSYGQNWDQTKYSKSCIDESIHKSIHAVQSRAKSVIGPCSAPGTPIAKKNLVR